MSDFIEDDYRKSIVRIFTQGKETPVGAGFLVSPGYVMTCAHVVLQAMGIKKDDYSDQLELPKVEIQLDFPILACGQKITAKVADWTPYNLDTGDIALLELTEPEPQDVKIIPFSQKSSISKSALCIYGFGEENNGGQTDAYQVKTQVAAGRWMLCKKEDEEDETIQPGYSGAPVWIKEEKALLGMVAAAKVSKSRAYVIPVFRLQAVLKNLELKVLIQSHLKAEESSSSTPFTQAVEAALRICNPNGQNTSVVDQIDQLKADRAAPDGWEKEGALVRFIIALAWQQNTSETIEAQLEEWIDSQGHDYSDLYLRYARNMKKINVQQDNTCEHLFVVLEPEEKQPDHFRVSIWPIGSREHYQPSSPPDYIVFQESLSKTELPKFIRKKARQKIGVIFPMIHLFMPCSLFCEPLEMQPIRKRSSLGSEYPLVYRPLNHTVQNNKAFTDTRMSKWESLIKKGQQLSSSVFRPINVSSDDPDDWVYDLEDIEAAILQNFESVSDIFSEIHQEFSLPVALWVRDSTFQAQVKDILKECFAQFPQTVHKRREFAMESQSKDKESPAEKELGHHIALLWDDPDLLPPITQF